MDSNKSKTQLKDLLANYTFNFIVVSYVAGATIIARTLIEAATEDLGQLIDVCLSPLLLSFGLRLDCLYHIFIFIWLGNLFENQ